MPKTISINEQTVSVKEYNGNKVVTFKDIDIVHGRADGTARKRFYDNSQHFIEGEDYYNLQKSEKRTLGFQVPNRGMIVLTESGYLMLAKSFTDDLAWKVQRELVNRYFKATEEAEPYEYFDKTYNGVPVLTTADISYFTGMSIATANYYLRTKAMRNVDYYYLEGESLKGYKLENPQASKLSSSLSLVTKSGFVKLCKEYCVKIEPPKCFEQPKQLELKPIDTEITVKPEKEYALPFSNQQFQDIIVRVRKSMGALDVLLSKVNRHNVKKSEFDCFREVIATIGSEIDSDLICLKCVKINTTSRLKL